MDWPFLCPAEQPPERLTVDTPLFEKLQLWLLIPNPRTRAHVADLLAAVNAPHKAVASLFLVEGIFLRRPNRRTGDQTRPPGGVGSWPKVPGRLASGLPLWPLQGPACWLAGRSGVPPPAPRPGGTGAVRRPAGGAREVRRAGARHRPGRLPGSAPDGRGGPPGGRWGGDAALLRDGGAPGVRLSPGRSCPWTALAGLEVHPGGGRM